jgi:hypothetical protein
MTDEEPPATGKTRVVNGKLQEWNGSAWVAFEFLRPQGTGAVGHPPYFYKLDDDDSETAENADSDAAGNDDAGSDKAGE